MAEWTVGAPLPARAEVERKVIDAVARALDREPGEVPLSAALTRELGAESLDFLDIAFTLEGEFQIQLPRLDILTRAAEHFGEDALVKDGRVTDFGLQMLRKGMPELDPRSLVPGLRPDDVIGMITPASFVRIVLRLLQARQELPAACPRCGAATRGSATAPELQCGRCDWSQPLPTGDEILLKDMIAFSQ
jgi:acyl carrier protein